MASSALGPIRTAELNSEFAPQYGPPRKPETTPDSAVQATTPHSADAPTAEDKVTLSHKGPPTNAGKVPTVDNSLTETTNSSLPANSVAVPSASSSQAFEAAAAIAPSPDAVSGTSAGLTRQSQSVQPPQSLSGSGPLASNSAPASSVAANAAESTAEQSLRELNRSLEEIGINPDSISLIRRAQLLPLANDPTALREYFRTSGVTGTVTESAPTPNSQGILDRISATHGSQPLTPTAPDGPGSELDVSA